MQYNALRILPSIHKYNIKKVQIAAKMYKYAVAKALLSKNNKC